MAFKFPACASRTEEEQFQNYSDKSYSFLEKSVWTLEMYKTFWDDYEDARRPFVQSQFKYRKDARTLGTFAIDIYETSRKERAEFNRWLNLHGDKYFSVNTFFSTGVESTGKLVLEEGYKADFKKPDFCLTGSNYVEYKTNKFDHIATYKVEDLKVYNDYQAYVLTEFYNRGKYSGYCLFTPDNLKTIVNKISAQELTTFPFAPFGYKPSVQFYTKGRNSDRSSPLNEYCDHIDLKV